MSEKSQLINKLTTQEKSREAYTRSKVSVNVASQIRALRRRRDMTQQTLASEAEMKQSRISAVERPGTRFNIETLVRLAAAFRVGLVVKFVSFSEMLRWENEFSQDSFDVLKIDNDAEFQKEEWPTPALPEVALDVRENSKNVGSFERMAPKLREGQKGFESNFLQSLVAAKEMRGHIYAAIGGSSGQGFSPS